MSRLSRWLRSRIGGANQARFDEALAKQRARPGACEPINKHELIEALRSLEARQAEDSLEVVELSAELFSLGERIRLSPLCDEVPHHLWHFLDDADIRHKDPVYGAQQRRALADWLRVWEAEP